jgi:hypothetical protein
MAGIAEGIALPLTAAFAKSPGRTAVPEITLANELDTKGLGSSLGK